MYNHQLRIFAAVLSFILVTIGASFAGINEDEQALISQLSVERMMETVERLCADDFAGRRAGSPEHYAVADYMVQRFEDAGLQAMDADNLHGYKQPLTMRYALIRSKKDIKATLAYAASDGRGLTQKEFAYRNFNGAGGLDLRSEVVFVGHGITDPSGYDDYSGIDVTGKIVMWLPGRPKGVSLACPVTDAHKIMTAYQNGAVACLMYKPAGAKDEKGTNIGLSGAIADFPYIAVDERIASDLFATTGYDIARLTADPGKRLGLHGTDIRLKVTHVCDPHRPTYNVVGVIPGTDPKVSDEVVVMGAHYDHLGTDEQGNVFRGADDNASGTAAILEIAEVIRCSGLKPRRTIVFTSWTAEEAGIIGSNHFVADMPFSPANVKSYFNLDMVGVGTPGLFMTTGASAYPEHYQHLASAGRSLGYELKADMIPGTSDHLAFARKRIPNSLIHSFGEHPHYHTIRDTPANLNRKVLESAARLALLAVWRAANA